MSLDRIITRLRIAYATKRYAKEGWLSVFEKKMAMLRPKRFEMGSGFVYNAYNLNSPAPSLMLWQLQLSKLKVLMDATDEEKVVFNRETFPLSRHEIEVKDFFTYEGKYIDAPARLEMCKWLLQQVIQHYKTWERGESTSRHVDYNSHVVETFLRQSEELVNGLLRFEP